MTLFLRWISIFIFLTTAAQNFAIELDRPIDSKLDSFDPLLKAKKYYRKRKKKEIKIPEEYPPFIVYVKKGALLTNLRNLKTVQTDSSFYSKAKTVPQNGDIIFLLNKKGKPLYEVNGKYTINMEQEQNLLPTTSSLEVYDQKLKLEIKQKEIPFQYFFNYYLESISTSYYPSLFRGNSKSAFANRLNFKTYYVTAAPINFGIDLDYQFGFWKDNFVGTVTWKTLLIGPNIHAVLSENLESSWHLHFGVGKSIYHQSQKGIDKHKYSTTTIKLDLDHASHSQYGKILIGGSLRLAQSTLTNSTELLINKPIKSSTLGIGISLGYLYD